MAAKDTTKYVILLIDGAADYPIDRMGGRTPLMVARTPELDRLAAEGRSGTLATVPEGMTPDSAVANLAVLGYDPREYYQGRGVLEAASLGVELGDDDVAMRMNLIALTDDDRIADHSAGHISSAEANRLVAALQERFNSDRVEIHPGVSYRHLLVLRGAEFSPLLECFPPHDHVGLPTTEARIRATDPSAEATAELLNRLVADSRQVLATHPVNQQRREAGKREAATIWPWAPGRKPTMETLQERYGIRGAVISAVDLIHGLGRYAGMTSIHVDGATGLFDTNYEGKARAALEALIDHDLVFVHVEGADEAGHARDLGLKIHCIESIDRRILGPLREGMKQRGWKSVIAALPDHLTPVERGDHVGEPVPVAIYDPDEPADAVEHFDEQSVTEGALGALTGAGLVDTLFRRRLQG